MLHELGKIALRLEAEGSTYGWDKRSSWAKPIRKKKKKKELGKTYTPTRSVATGHRTPLVGYGSGPFMSV
jgi:hypothetical protein